tara:strand:- start:3166 stop:3333 length:168 start_codon:yes stop_codon:yes gene_type:complete
MKKSKPSVINTAFVPSVDFCEDCGYIVALPHLFCEDKFIIEADIEIDFINPEDYV